MGGNGTALHCTAAGVPHSTARRTPRTSFCPVPRRNLIPFLLLALLGIGTLVFALLGASSAPSGATLTVQNGSDLTFSNSFALDLVNTLSTARSNGTISQVRQVDYKAPDRMSVYQEVGSSSKLIAVLSPSAVACSLSTYRAVVGGSTSWTASGKSFVRTESLADYDARVPHATATTCTPQPSSVLGSVHERAAVRAGYLVGVRLTVVVPPQKLASGQQAAGGVENQALVLLQVNGIRVSTLGK